MSEVKLKKVREEVVAAKTPEGLKDGGHVLIACSNCQAVLMDVWRTRPNEPETWKVKAQNCPFCDDNPKTKSLGGSFVNEVKGGFHVGGYGEMKEDDPGSDIPSTVVDHFDTQGDTLNFVIKKAKHDAKPIRAR